MISVGVEMVGDLGLDISALKGTVEDRPLKAILRKALRPIVSPMRAAAPRLTGRMARSVKVRIYRREITGTVGPGTEVYDRGNSGRRMNTWATAYWSEYGTKRQPARPWIRPAIAGQDERVAESIGRELEAAWERAGGR